MKYWIRLKNLKEENSQKVWIGLLVTILKLLLLIICKTTEQLLSLFF